MMFLWARALKLKYEELNYSANAEKDYDRQRPEWHHRWLGKLNECLYASFDMSMRTSLCLVLQLQEIFRKKNEKKGRKGDAEKSAQLVRRTRGCSCGRRGAVLWIQNSILSLNAFTKANTEPNINDTVSLYGHGLQCDKLDVQGTKMLCFIGKPGVLSWFNLNNQQRLHVEFEPNDKLLLDVILAVYIGSYKQQDMSG